MTSLGITRPARSELFEFPAKLALITHAVTGEPIGVQRTAIKDDGSGKRFGANSKRMLGVVRHGAVRLQAASEHLGIAEGIETALSAMQVFKTPVWATLSSRGIATFPRSRWDQKADGIC